MASMNDAAPELTTSTVTVFTRHATDCTYKDKPQWKRCKCRKHVYLYEGGKKTYISAKTRSWEQAERFAQTLRDERDPVKIKLRQIEAADEAKKAAARARESSIEAALDQWIAGYKVKADSPTGISYETFRKWFLKWTDAQGFQLLSDVTADALDAWVASWSPDAEDKASRLSANTQNFRLTKIKSFFRWAFNLRKLEQNPAVMLRSIKAENEEITQPLTPEQFRELLAATYKYDEDRRVDKDRFGADLRAIFLVMRWTGVRLSDALMLRRSGVVGNRLKMDIQKTGDKIDRVVPMEVIDALAAVPTRKTMHADQFFWSRQCNHRVLAGMWTPRIRRINKYVSFQNEEGEPMSFHSHMLRDTFAVELLLAGMPLEKVSKLLCHSSVRITEKHYAPWVERRNAQLEDEMMAAMRMMGARFDGD